MGEYSREELSSARKQLASTRMKLCKVVATLEAKENAPRLKSQITLAKRRIAALDIALALIDERAGGGE